MALPTRRKSEPPGRPGFGDGGQGRERSQSALYKELNICKFLPVATQRSNCPLPSNAQANRSRKPTTQRGDTEGLWSPGTCRAEDSGKCVSKDKGHMGGMYLALPLCFGTLIGVTAFFSGENLAQANEPNSFMVFRLRFF